MAVILLPVPLAEALASVAVIRASVLLIDIGWHLYHWLRGTLYEEVDDDDADAYQDYMSQDIDPDDFEGAEELREEYYADHPEERGSV